MREFGSAKQGGRVRRRVKTRIMNLRRALPCECGSGRGFVRSKAGERLSGTAVLTRLMTCQPALTRVCPLQPTSIFSAKRGWEAISGRAVWIFAGKITGCYAKVREVSRKFAQIRPVIPRCYAFLRVRLIFYEDGKQENKREQEERAVHYQGRVAGTGAGDDEYVSKTGVEEHAKDG